MIYLPQHPVHYVFGMPSHAPLSIKAWMQESFELKSRLFLWYFSFFVAVGSLTRDLQSGFDMAGIYILSIFIMALPSAIFDPKDSSILSSLSEAYFNAVLSFHGFLLTYFVLYNAISIGAIYAGIWTLELSFMIVGLSLSLMVGFSMQQAVATNKRLPWAIVPLLSISSGAAVFFFLGSQS
jgi:hypothetical protein